METPEITAAAVVDWLHSASPKTLREAAAAATADCDDFTLSASYRATARQAARMFRALARS